MSRDYSPATILFLVTEDWYFVSHRLPVARIARDAGFTVHVAARLSTHEQKLRQEGFIVHSLPWQRSGEGLVRSVRSLLAIRAVIKAVKPDILHAVALKPTVFGAVAARTARMRGRVFAIAGLGFAFTDQTWKARLIRLCLRVVFQTAVDRADAVVLLQNDDDRHVLARGGFVKRARTRIIRGSGVDTDWFSPLPPPETNPPTIAVVSRMIAIKGIATLVEASRLLRCQGILHRLLLVGTPDPHNASSILQSQLEEWAKEPGTEWLGHCDDVRTVWAQAHIAALTSYGGEGLPKSLLEAAACERPIVASDVAGNREIAVEGVNALLAPPGDAPALALALRRLLENEELRLVLGRAGRRLVVEQFSQERVAELTLALYQELLGSSVAV